jgi:hypothetical protein
MESEYQHSVRQYNKDRDFSYIYHALKSYGMKEDEMIFEEANTFLTDYGFFSVLFILMEDEIVPVLKHFYVDPDKRSFDTAHALYSTFRDMMLEMGFLYFIASRLEHEENYKALFKYRGASRPFAVRDDTQFYLIPLRRMRHEENLH